jgi:hypothetical protein
MLLVVKPRVRVLERGYSLLQIANEDRWPEASGLSSAGKVDEAPSVVNCLSWLRDEETQDSCRAGHRLDRIDRRASASITTLS